MASAEEDMTETPKGSQKDDCWWNLPEMSGEIDPEAPFITKEAIESYSISYLKSLADFYGFPRAPDLEPADMVDKVPTLEETCSKLQERNYRKDLASATPDLETDRFSTISVKEQKTYFDLYQKYDKQVMTQPTPEEFAEIKKLGELHSKVVLEQEEFKKFIKETSASRKDLYEFLTCEMERYVKDLSLSKLNAAVKYPCFYKYEQIIQFFSQEKILKEAPVKLSLEKVVLTLGLVPRLVLPVPNMKCTLPKEYGKIYKRFPALKKDLDSHPSKKVCSQDSIALSLAAKYKADVVLTLSSFKTLLLLPPYENNWELIVTVIVTEDNHKIVIVDKQLCPGARKARDQSQRYYKYSSKIQFTHFNPTRNKPNESAKKVSPEKGKRGLVVQDLEMFEAENADSILDLEVFGLASPPKKPSVVKESKIATKESKNEINEPTACESKDESIDEKVCSETIKDIVDAIEKGFIDESVAKAAKAELIKKCDNVKVPETEDKAKPDANKLRNEECETNSESENLVIDISEAPSDIQVYKDPLFDESMDDDDDLPLKIYVKDIPKRVIATRSKTKLHKLHSVADSPENDAAAMDIDNKEKDIYDKMDLDDKEILSPDRISPQSPTDTGNDSIMNSPKIIPLHEQEKEPA